jgi:preprotein translocase subunit SecG
MRRNGILILGMIVVFAVIVALMLHALPGPHRPSDYMVIGTLATLACLALVFIVLLRTEKRTQRKRPNPDVSGPDEPQ